MLDWVFEKIPDLKRTSLQIGNEIDINAISTPIFWKQYETFVREVAQHVHTKRPRAEFESREEDQQAFRILPFD